MKKLSNLLVTGALVLVPLLATIGILRWFVSSLDSTARSYMPSSLLPFDFQGLGLLIALVVVLLAGLLTHVYIGRWLVRWFDSLVRRMPVVGGIYKAISKVLETVFHPNTEQFSGTCLVQFPRAGAYSIGFRTGKPDHKLASKVPDKKLVNVFVPCTPNPTSGFYILVPEDELIPLDLSAQEAFKIVISTGIVTSDDNE